MGFPLSPAAISSFDDSYASASVAGSATVTIGTTTGKGSASVVVSGDGDPDVTIKYSVDGGADTAIGTSDKQTYIALGFNTSLVLKATNANASPKNRSGVSCTGVKQ